MKKIGCDFCGREKKEEELIKYGEARICSICETEQKKNRKHGKIIKGEIKNSQLTK
jgi:sarcosine oxidase delta subunit